MKRLLVSLLFVILFHHFSFSQRDTSIIYLMEIKQDIDKSSMRKLNIGIKEAEKLNSDYIILDLNTYGGAVDAADSMRTAILQSPIPVVAFINIQAASAGALISIACDSIYMRSGSSIGAATVVNQEGKVMPDKYQSFMRGMMRSTAESHGKRMINKDGRMVYDWHRDPHIAESMVDTANVLSLTQEEAIEQHYCEGKAESVEEVISQLDVGDYVVKEQKLSFLHKLILFLLSPALQGIFLMMIIGGVYFEMQSPGIGFPLAAAIVGALLYFAPLYLAGLALNWEIVVFVVGVIFLVLEIFLFPGFGVFGILGVVMIIFSLVFAMVDNDLFYYNGDFDFKLLLKPLTLVLVSFFFGLVLSIWGAGKLYPKKSFGAIALKTELKESDGWVGVKRTEGELISKEVEVFTDLHPSGKIVVNNAVYEATMEFGSANKGDKVRIVREEGGRFYCEKVNV